MGMSDEKYTSQEASLLYGVSVETINQWSREFAMHLSPTANPGNRQARRFTPDDLSVFDLIATLRADKANTDNIQAALAAGQRGSRPEASVQELRDLLIASQENKLAMEIQLLQRHLADLRQQHQEAVAQLEKERQQSQVLAQENARLQAKIEVLTETLDARLQDAREIGRLQAELENQRKNP